MFAFFSMNAQKNAVKASGVIGNYGVQYERLLGKNFSLIGQVGYSSLTTTVGAADSKSNGLGYYAEGRFYFSSKKDAMEGWHIGVFYNDINTSNSSDLKTDINSVGLVLGYQWVFDSKMTMGISFGGGSLNIDSEIAGLEIFNAIGFLPQAGISIGYSF